MVRRGNEKDFPFSRMIEFIQKAQRAAGRYQRPAVFLLPDASQRGLFILCGSPQNLAVPNHFDLDVIGSALNLAANSVHHSISIMKDTAWAGDLSGRTVHSKIEGSKLRRPDGKHPVFGAFVCRGKQPPAHKQKEK